MFTFQGVTLFFSTHGPKEILPSFQGGTTILSALLYGDFILSAGCSAPITDQNLCHGEQNEKLPHETRIRRKHIGGKMLFFCALCAVFVKLWVKHTQKCLLLLKKC